MFVSKRNILDLIDELEKRTTKFEERLSLLEPSPSFNDIKAWKWAVLPLDSWACGYWDITTAYFTEKQALKAYGPQGKSYLYKKIGDPIDVLEPA